jgi:membrane-associated phospholipid phosphatase
VREPGIVLVVLAVAGVSCQAGTDLWKLDPWARDDAVAERSSPEVAPQFSIAAESLGTPSQVSPVVAPVEDVFKKNYWYLVLLDIKEVFTAPVHWDSQDWLVAGGVVASIGTVAAFDEDIERAIRRHRNDTLTTVFDNIQPLGNEYAIGIIGTFYIYGEIFKDPRAKTTALDSIAATAIASGIATNSFKYVIGRGRPTDGHGAYDFEPFSGRDSFSSGHTTEAFALASVITEHYNSIWVQIPAYGLAGMVGYARLNNNRHWPSDVLAGAAIGTFTGKTIVRFNERHRKVSIKPIVGPNVNGAELSLPW